MYIILCKGKIKNYYFLHYLKPHLQSLRSLDHLITKNVENERKNNEYAYYYMKG